MLTDREIIEQFQLQVSWADSCKIVELDGFTMLAAQYVLYMPCNWQDYHQRKHRVIALAQTAGYTPGLIIAGNPDLRSLNLMICDPTLPETMIFRGKSLRFQMQLQFIDPKTRADLNKTVLWEIEEPF